MTRYTSSPNIGSGISQVLDAVNKELENNIAVGHDLDNLFWSSVNAVAEDSRSGSLDSVFYSSIIDGDAWEPKQQSRAQLSSSVPVFTPPPIPTSIPAPTSIPIPVSMPAQTSFSPPRGEPVFPARPPATNVNDIVSQIAEQAARRIRGR